MPSATKGPADQPETIIEIEERGSRGPGAFDAVVRFRDQPGDNRIVVTDPAGQGTEQLLTWYFETYAVMRSGRSGQLSRVDGALADYGTELFKQVFRGDRLFESRYENCRRRQFRGCRLRILGSDAFHRLHWETIRDPDESRPILLSMPVERYAVDVKRDYVVPSPGPMLNVLVVAARPFGAADLAYRTMSRTLLRIFRNHEIPVRIDLARPGTWLGLARHLEEQSDQDRFYQVVHFDLHGSLLSEQQLTAGTGSGRLKAHGRVKEFAGQQAFLYFETAQDGVADPVPAEEVADLLRRHQVGMAVLGACQSARGATDEVGLAQRLAEAGVPVTVGMAYSITATAAQLAIPRIYEKLAAGKDPAQAVRDARLALFDSPERTVLRGPIDMQDWLLPVIFQQQDVNLRLREMTTEEREKWLKAEIDAGPEPPVYDRDLDVLAVERRLLDVGAHNILFLHGPSRVGRTDFLRLLVWWWVRTGLVTEVVSFDLREDPPWTARRLVDALVARLPLEAPAPVDRTARLGAVVQGLRRKGTLLILDGIARADADDLLPLLRELERSPCLVLLAARAEPPWLRTLAKSDYELTATLPPTQSPETKVDAPVDPGSDNAERTDLRADEKRPQQTRRRWIGGLAVLLVLSAGGVAAVLSAGDRPSDPATDDRAPDSSAVESPGGETVSPTGAGVDPAWLTAAAAGGARVTSPLPEAKVGRCLTVKGTAPGLAAERTIIVGFRRDDVFAGSPYRLYRIANPDQPGSADPWSVLLPVNGALWQHFEVIVVSAGRDAVRTTWQRSTRDPQTTDPSMPGLEPKLEARQTVELHDLTGSC